MRDDEGIAAVEALNACLDGVLDLDLSALSSVGLTSLVTATEKVRRRLEAADHRQLAALTERNVAGEYGRTSTADLLVELLRLSPGEAKTRVGAAGDLGPRRALSGEPLAPLFAHVAAAVAQGAVGAGQVRVITRCLTKLPPHLDGPAVERAERVLVEAAAHLNARQLGQVAERLLAHADPDGVEPREDRARRLRGFTLVRHADGSCTPTGTLTPAATAVWACIIDALSVPLNDSGNGADGDAGADSAEGGGAVERDDRSPAQRRHDGLLEAGLRLLRSGTLPDSGGVPVTILARIDADQLREQLRDLLRREADQRRYDSGWSDAGGSDCGDGVDGCAGGETAHDTDTDGEGHGGAVAHGADRARGMDGAHGPTAHDAGGAHGAKTGPGGVAITGTGDLIAIRELLQLASEAEIIPVVLNDTGGILSYGRTRRLATCAQRKALALRDGGCCFPGCTRPASWCQTHHVIPWLTDGLTDLENLCLLCAHHHREFDARGWAVHMRNGVPEWIPPPWLDPLRRPRRNTAHHPPDIDFDVGLTG